MTESLFSVSLSEAAREDLRVAMMREVERNNVACDECLDLLMVTSGAYAMGRNRNHFATWAVSTKDMHSYWGHYDFATESEARADLYKRAGLELGSLDELI